MSQLKNVKEFLEASGAEIPESPFFNKQKSILCVKLLFEELSELCAEMGEDAYDTFIDLCKSEVKKPRSVLGDGSLESIVREAVDLEYVLYNLVVFFGFKNVWAEVEQYVHQCNMNKFHKTWDEAKVTIELCKHGAYPGRTGQIIDAISEKNKGYIVVKDKKTGKVLKNVSHKGVSKEVIKNIINSNEQ